MQVNPDDILHQYKMGMCAQNDKAQWIATVKQLYEDTNLWHEYSRNARRYAEENHNLEIIAEEFFGLLKKLSL